MKTLHLSLKKEILLVELPEGAGNVIVYNGNIHYDALIGMSSDPISPSIDKIIGKLSDLTEEGYEKLVHDSLDMGFYGGTMLYKDYSGEYGNPDEFDDFFDTAKESFESAVEAEGFVFESLEPNEEDYESDMRYEADWHRWNNRKQPESHTFHPELTYIFELAK